ncbi:MAG: bifunctional hydroxymethylpyrimidine kinase/phosphomethylpyrimidine kinase, partial [Candidatus Marinimicrobia bacterium]|nr:bifunctional hydroxymethylpyrimidine kinase/phosphomethylpyrimidine kinase [Candidatus Neomarinimicrobiota bacterium]
MIKKHLQSLTSKHITVIGDAILDIFSTGKVDRQSPEAPVDVLDLLNMEDHLGGALNVCLNLVSLGASAEIIGVLGDDFEAFRLEYLCDKNMIKRSSMLREKGRITTSKTRFFNNDIPLLRVDHELRLPISDEMQNNLIKEIRRVLKITDVCILQDYNKGVLTPRMIDEIMDMTKKEGVPVFVDPKFENIDLYKDAFLIKPNRHEAEVKLGYAIKDIETAKTAARELFDRLGCENILLTLGSEGMILRNAEQILHIPAIPIETADITGAGDTVISVLAALYSTGMPIETCVQFANQGAAEI